MIALTVKVILMTNMDLKNESFAVNYYNMIQLIYATNLSGCIGISNNAHPAGTLPWFDRQKADMKYFMETTKNSIVIMGRSTWESLKKPLSGRTNIVISSTLPDDPRDNVFICQSPTHALELAKNIRGDSDKEIFFIGGKSIYEFALGVVDRIHRTLIQYQGTTIDGSSSTNNVYWDGILQLKILYEFENISSTEFPADSLNQYGYHIGIWDRKK